LSLLLSSAVVCALSLSLLLLCVCVCVCENKWRFTRDL